MKVLSKTLFFAAAVLFLLPACSDDDEGPAELTTLGAGEITSNSATSGGNVTSEGGAPVSARGVVWGDAQSPTLESHLGLTVDGGGPGVFQSSLSNLDEGRSYYVRAYATNPAGTAYGQQIAFSTITNLPGVTTLEVTNITPTSAESGGEVTDEGEAPVIARGVVWSTEEGPSLSHYSGFTSDGSGTGPFTSMITGLTNDETYHVRAYAVNAEGTRYGQASQFTTLPCSPVDTEVTDVLNPATGLTWMDRNIGAAAVASSPDDQAAYGDLYQWGRAGDGHQCMASGVTNVQADSPSPPHHRFITSSNDWLTPQNDNLWQGVNGVNNPCPEGYRLPTEAEWDQELQSWSSNDIAGAFESPLKLTSAGWRGSFDGGFYDGGSAGYYYSSTVSGPGVVMLNFSNSHAFTTQNSRRSNACSVRCIKD